MPLNRIIEYRVIEYSYLITAIGFFIHTSIYGWAMFEVFAQASLVIIYFLVRCNCRLLEENQPTKRR